MEFKSTPEISCESGCRKMPWQRLELYAGKLARTVVRPAKAGMFSRSQSCGGRSQRPRSLDSRVAGNQDLEAYRRVFPWGMRESSGRNNSERKGGLESEKSR